MATTMGEAAAMSAHTMANRTPDLPEPLPVLCDGDEPTPSSLMYSVISESTLGIQETYRYPVLSESRCSGG
jgi:hypothetical protein